MTLAIVSADIIGEGPIPTISEKPVNSLGCWYDASLKDKEQADQLRKEVASSLKKHQQNLASQQAVALVHAAWVTSTLHVGH